jgi:hypothetical protein
MTYKQKMQLASIRIKHLELLNKALDKGTPVSFWPRIGGAK